VKEKLTIKNFGPIKSVELELGRFNVLIGENATGKSIVGKLLAVCRYFSYIIDNETFFEQPFEKGLYSWGLIDAIQNDSFISYVSEHYSFTAERIILKEIDRDQESGEPFEIERPAFNFNLFDKSSKFEALLNELEKIKPKAERMYDLGFVDWTIPSSFFQNDVAVVMANPFYVPTERGLQSLFSLGKNSIQNISDSLFNQFAKLDHIARLFKNDTSIEPLDVTYKNVNGQGYIKSRKHSFLSLYNAASGYQSTVPIVLLTKYYSELRKKNKTFIIEEPELNLFPTAQNKLMQFLVDKIMNYGNSLLVTTHSPYTLTSVNNLIYAYQVGQNHVEEVEHVIEKKYWLNPADVSAYRLSEDGTAKNILDEEMKLIEAGELDEISRSLNEIFDKIANVEYSTVDEN
jgi:predicted ATP-dependent endonuclease of OLD family